MPGKERAKYLFRIARIIQERGRELAVARVDRQRQADQGDARRRRPDRGGALLLLRRLGRQAGVRWLPAATLAPLGVAGQVIPWNFPLLMLAWKIAPALACGNTVVLKPAETTPLTALLLAEIFQEADLPAGRRQHRHRRRRHRRGRWSTIRTSTRSPSPARPRSARRSPRPLAGTDKRVTLELGGKAANIVFDDAPLDQAVEGIVNGIFFNQGHVCCAGSRLLVQESVADEVLAKLKRRMRDAARRRPARQEHRHRRDQLRGAARPRSASSSDIGEQEGAERWSAALRAARPRVLVPRRRSSPASRRPTGSPARRSSARCSSVLTFRTPAEAVEKANNTPYGSRRGVWTDKGSRILKMATALRAGVVWANTFNKFDPTSPFGGYKESGYGREGGRHGLEGYLQMSTHRRPQDLQALHRRGVPPFGVGPLLRRERRARPLRRERGAGLAQGRPRRRRRRAQGVPGLVRPDGVQPRAGALPRRRGDGGPSTTVRRRRPPGRGRHRRGRRQGRRRSDRPPGLVRRLGRQGHPGGRQRQPRGRSVLQPLDTRADRRRRRPGARGLEPARSRQCRRAGRRHRQHRGRRRLAGATTAGDHLRRGARHLRPARRRRQPADRRRSPTPRRRWPPTWTSTRST